MRTIKILFLTIIFWSAVVTMFAQQNQTLYFMHRVPQSNLLNPAIQNECKLYLSGMALPIVGQVMPPMHVNYNNNGFAFNKLFYYGTGIMADSMITPFHNGQDPYRFLDRLRKVNYVSMETDIDWLSAGYRWKNWYFTFNLTEKLDIQTSYPKDLIFLGWEGNGKSLLGKESFLSYLGASVNWYREWALGASTTINKKWSVGARGKLLFGKENLWFKSHQLTWKTDETDYTYTFKADWEMYSSQQFYDITKLQMDYLNDSLMFEMDTVLDPGNITGKDIKKIIMDGRNPGGAIDLGFKYVYNNKINIYGSILDLGFIRYKNNVNAIKASGEFVFDGWDIQPNFNSNDSVAQAYADHFKDSVIKLFDPKLVKKSYSYWLAPKMYLGGTYTINPKFNVGLLFRGDIFLKRLHGGVTLSGNANLTKWFMGTLSYTVENNSFKQLGAGVLFKIPWFQFYIVTDNVNGFIWPQAARNVNFRLGINMLFGCDKKQTSTLVN
jgi:hypothetical protein